MMFLIKVQKLFLCCHLRFKILETIAFSTKYVSKKLFLNDIITILHHLSNQVNSNNGS